MFDKSQLKALGAVKMKNIKTEVSVLRVIKLLAKAIKFGRDGFSREELRELGADLLQLGIEILEDLDE
ncbi:MAG: hypothetical protein EBV86_17710 [Marivivens sp.]|nr:hypothetical protein [Marivivens sp.]